MSYSFDAIRTIDSLSEFMGKYQLDDKGKAQVRRFHEKNSVVKTDKKSRVQELLKQAQKKK